jgi:phosphoribosylglycinamide formyltransferase 2
MQIADYSLVFPMTDGDLLKENIETVCPDYIIPEIEAINVETLIEMEEKGYNVVPNASAVQITMNRKLLRKLVANKLCIHTSNYMAPNTLEELKYSIKNIVGIPCVVKPNMSSSGKGQTIIKDESEIEAAWNYAESNSRGKSEGVIVEKFLEFDYEITLLTVKHRNGISICPPIGHTQKNGDFNESWQPCVMDAKVLNKCSSIAKCVVEELGGYGIFGVEFFIMADGEVVFNEISPRPHDTGMITLISQNISEFDLHVSAILGCPIPQITLVDSYGYYASKALVFQTEKTTENFEYIGIPNKIATDKDTLIEIYKDTYLRMFNKHELRYPSRRMGVVFAKGDCIFRAREKTRNIANSIGVRISRL